jgi:hypothetical protein
MLPCFGCATPPARQADGADERLLAWRRDREEADKRQRKQETTRLGFLEGSKTLSGAREVLLQGSFYEVSLALVGVASLAYFQY